MTKTGFGTTRAALLCAAAACAPRMACASDFTTIFHFANSKTGEAGVEGRLTAIDGAIYGAAESGGTAGHGTVFRLDLSTDVETTLYSFAGGKKYGAVPFGPLTHLGAGVYGSTIEGHGTGPGSNGNYTGYGTIFRVDAKTGKGVVFHGFDGKDGSQPYSGVTPVGHVFYGTTWYGGTGNAGTVFRINADHSLATLYNFPNSTIGCNPVDGVVLVGSVLYGTTSFCGSGGSGTVYSFDLTSGKAALLYSFPANGNGSVGANEIIVEHGAIFGTTFSDGGAGSAYKIELKSGTYTLLHQFSGGADGDTPSSGLTELGGKLYGVTQSGGLGAGTIYALDPRSGAQSVVYEFTGGEDGNYPFAGLLSYKGALYGSTLNLYTKTDPFEGTLFKFVP